MQDVYSFAIVMWEMLMWEAPYEDMMSVQVRSLLARSAWVLFFGRTSITPSWKTFYGKNNARLLSLFDCFGPFTYQNLQLSP